MRKKKLLLRESRFDEAETNELSDYLKEVASWVGIYIFTFNMLEKEITDLSAEHIDGTLEKNDYAYIFLSDMQYTTKIDLLERYYRFTLSSKEKNIVRKLLEQLDQIFIELREIGYERNSIVHADYLNLDKGGFIREKIKYKKDGIEESRIEINKQTFTKCITRIEKVYKNLDHYDEEINNIML